MRILRRAALYLKMIYETWFNHVLLSLVVAAMVVSAVYTVSLYDDYYGVIYAAKKHGLEDKIIVYNDNSISDPFNVDSDYVMRYLEKAESIDGIKRVEYLGDMGTEFNSVDKNLHFMMDDCSSLINSGYEYDLLKGRNPEIGSYNEVLINTVAAEYYDVGDTITVSDFLSTGEFYYAPKDVYYQNGRGTLKYYTLTFTVVGIIDDHSWIVTGEGKANPPVITDIIFDVANDLNRNAGKPMIYSGALMEQGGKHITLSNYMTLIITLEDKKDAENVKARLQDELGSYKYILTYDDYVKNYQNLNSSLKNTVIKYTISFCLISFMILAAVIFTKFQKRKEEIHSYYLCGETWHWCILSSIKMFIPALILGTIIGGVILINGKDTYLYELNDKFINAATIGKVFVVYLILIIIVMIPVYFSLRNKSLRDFREE